MDGLLGHQPQRGQPNLLDTPLAVGVMANSGPCLVGGKKGEERVPKKKNPYLGFILRLLEDIRLWTRRTYWTSSSTTSSNGGNAQTATTSAFTCRMFLEPTCLSHHPEPSFRGPHPTSLGIVPRQHALDPHATPMRLHRYIEDFIFPINAYHISCFYPGIRVAARRHYQPFPSLTACILVSISLRVFFCRKLRCVTSAPASVLV